MTHEKSKIIIVVIILLILISGIIVVRKIKKPSVPVVNVPTETEDIVEQLKTPANSILLKSESTGFTVGNEFLVNILFSAPGKSVFGTDLVILYDPEYLSTKTEKITSGDFFTSFPRISVDAQRGVIKISAYQGSPDILSDTMQEIANVSFTAVKTGNTNIELQFTPGTTNTTTLVENETSQNILTGTEGLAISITP